jgi:hypothetical protein
MNMPPRKKKEVDKKNKIMERKVDRSLKCLLTQDEVLKAGDAVAKELNDIDRLENELASVSKSIKSKIQEAQARADRNRILISNKYDYRTVVCTEVKDYTKCRVTITRDDTEELVEDRAMTADERQIKLFDAPENAENPEQEEEFEEDDQV